MVKHVKVGMDVRLICFDKDMHIIIIKRGCLGGTGMLLWSKCGGVQ